MFMGLDKMWICSIPLPSQDTDAQLLALSNTINDFRQYKVTLLGDFNARFYIYEKLWRVDYNTKKRSDSFEEFLMAYDLVVSNPYNVKTFENANGSSVIDLVIPHQCLSNNTEDVRVCDATLSQHACISFVLKVDRNEQAQITRFTLNETKFRDALCRSRGKLEHLFYEISESNDVPMLDGKVDKITKFITSMAEECREEVVDKKNNKWWDSELEKLKHCVKILKRRAKVARGKSERATLILNQEKFRLEYEIYSNTLSYVRKKYRSLILERKSKAWERFVRESTV